jgi:hypothetical protein
MKTKTRVAALAGAVVLVLAAIVALYALLGADAGIDDTDAVRVPGGSKVYLAVTSRSAGVFLVVLSLLLGGVSLLTYFLGAHIPRPIPAFLVGCVVFGMVLFGLRVLPAWRVISSKSYVGWQVPALLWSAALVIVGALLVLVSTPWGHRR